MCSQSLSPPKTATAFLHCTTIDKAQGNNYIVCVTGTHKYYAVEYEWMPKEPSNTTSDFLRDILSYLESIFANLQNLPVRILHNL